MELAKNLTKHCKEKGLTLAALARLSGVKQPTLFGWTTGRKVHKMDDLKKVCSVLGISIHCILYGEADPFETDNFIEEFVWGNLRITLRKNTQESKRSV